MYWYGEGMGAGWYWLMAVSWVLFLALVVIAVVLAIRHFGRTGRQGGQGASFWTPYPGAQQPGGQQPAGQPGVGRPPEGPSPQAGPAPWVSPEQVLAERYARGEIDDEEYQRRLSTLRAAATAPDGPHP